MSIFKTILFATDLTDINFKLAQNALKISEQNSAEFHLLHVTNFTPTYILAHANILGLVAELEEESKKRLNEIRAKLKVESDKAYLKNGSCKFEIVETAKKIKADLIIVGSHSQQGFLGSLGSTASGVVNNAPCHVLILKSD